MRSVARRAAGRRSPCRLARLVAPARTILGLEHANVHLSALVVGIACEHLAPFAERSRRITQQKEGDSQEHARLRVLGIGVLGCLVLLARARQVAGVSVEISE